MTERARPDAAEEKAGRFPLHMQMLAGLVAGLLLGLAANWAAEGAAWVGFITTYVTGPIGQIFLRLLFMLVIPLLFAALVTGVGEMGDLASLRRVGIRTLFFTFLLSTISVLIALALVNLIRPGDGVDPVVARDMLASAREGAGAIVGQSRDTPSGVASFLAIIPSNVFRAAAQDDILAVMVFALAFGIGMVVAEREKVATLAQAIEGMLEVTLTLIGFVIRLAPIAVFSFMFNLTAEFGADVLVRLGAFVGTVIGALAIQMLVIYPICVWLFAGRGPVGFFRGVQAPMLMAFSTASSNATLPTALSAAEHELKLPRKISRFVLTIGATANQNGTAMFEGVAVIFLAQFFGVELTLAQQGSVMLVCILGGIGTAGVPAGSLPVVAIILASVGVPPVAIGLILGVDRLLDMCRTMLNVTGDLAIAAMVTGRGEQPATAS